MIQTIPIINLLFMLIFIVIVGYFYYIWIDNAKEVLVATLRMISQLLMIGYVLSLIFESESMLDDDWTNSFRN